MDLHTDFPERLQEGRTLFGGDDHTPLIVSGTRPHAKGLLVKFKGVETPEDAGQLRNQWVYVKSTDVPSLPEGKLYQHELFGFQVIDEHENLLGELVEIIETGANSVYVVRNESGK